MWKQTLVYHFSQFKIAPVSYEFFVCLLVFCCFLLDDMVLCDKWNSPQINFCKHIFMNFVGVALQPKLKMDVILTAGDTILQNLGFGAHFVCQMSASRYTMKLQ